MSNRKGTSIMPARGLPMPEVRRWREQAHLAQEDLALRAGIGLRTVRRAEAGLPISPAARASLAAAFDDHSQSPGQKWLRRNHQHALGPLYPVEQLESDCLDGIPSAADEAMEKLRETPLLLCRSGTAKRLADLLWDMSRAAFLAALVDEEVARRIHRKDDTPLPEHQMAILLHWPLMRIRRELRFSSSKTR